MWLPINSILEQNVQLAKEVNKASELFGLLENGIYLYPFKLGQGFNRVSNKGVNYNLNDDVKDYLGHINVQDINKPIIANWVDSWTQTSNNDGTTNRLRVGKKIIGFNADTTWNLNVETIQLNNLNLTDTYTSHSLTLTFFYEPTISTFANTAWEWDDTKLTDYLYVVVNPITQTNQFLVAESITPFFVKSEENKTTPLGWQVQFSSLNLKFNNAGKNILNFVQCGAVGAPYAWPKEILKPDGNIDVVLDKSRALLNQFNDWDYSSLGVDTIQVDYDISPLYCCMWAAGVPAPTDQPNIISKDENGNVYGLSYYTQNPKMLLMSDTAPIDPNITLLDGQLNTKYVLINQAKPVAHTIYNGWESWINRNQTFGNDKIFQGGLQIDDLDNKVEQSNAELFPITNNGFQFRGVLNYFNGITPYTPEQYTLTNPTPAEVNNNNALVYLGQNSISLDYDAGFRFSVGDIPIIGRILKKFMLGLNPTYILGLSPNASNRLNANIPINGLMTLEQFKMVKTGLIPSSTKDQPIAPMEIFSNEPNNYNATLNKQLASAFCFRLTDRYFDRDGTQRDTDYLGQKKDKNGNTLTANQSQYLKAAPSSNRFFITNVWNKAIGKPNIRLVFRNDYFKNSNGMGKNVAQFWQQSNSKFKGDASLWLNSWDFDAQPSAFSSLTTWPVAVVNLPPPDQTSDTFGGEQPLLTDNNNKIEASNVDVAFSYEAPSKEDKNYECRLCFNSNFNNLVYHSIPVLSAEWKHLRLYFEYNINITYATTRKPTDGLSLDDATKTDDVLVYKGYFELNKDDNKIYIRDLIKEIKPFPIRNPNANVDGKEIPKYKAATLEHNPPRGKTTYTDVNYNALYFEPSLIPTVEFWNNGDVIGSFELGVNNLTLNISKSKMTLIFNTNPPANEWGYKTITPALFSENKTYPIQWMTPVIGRTQLHSPQWGYGFKEYVSSNTSNFTVKPSQAIVDDYLTLNLTIINATWSK